MLCSVLILTVVLCGFPTDAFRGLPSLPGYLNAFGGSSSSEEERTPFYNRGLRVYNGLERLGAKEKDPVLSQIRHSVQLDIQKISDEVGLVSKHISAIYNDRSIGTEQRNEAIRMLTEQHPKVVPAILNLIGNLHNHNHQNAIRFDRI